MILKGGIRLTYQEIYGNLFDYYSRAFLAHCISADFALGKGIALEFDRRYDVKRKLKLYNPNYLSWYKENNIGGDAIIVDSIINLVTKERYFHKPTYRTLEIALTKLADIIKMNNIENIAMPLIGCGLDRLSWDRVSVMVQNIFSDQNCNITVVKR